MMDATAAATISHQLGTQPATPTTLLAARELAACGCFKRAAFLRGLAQQAAEQPPLQLMQTLDRLCHEAGLFAPAQLLHDLLPTPQQAADLIHQAACSQAVCGALIHSSCWGRVCASTTASDCALQAVLRLLQSLLVCSFDAAACGTADPAACDTALQQYVLAMLQHLQEAAARQEVLAVCLLQAAASCGVLCDEAAVARCVQGVCHGPPWCISPCTRFASVACMTRCPVVDSMC
jgi:hypothetical protein